MTADRAAVDRQLEEFLRGAPHESGRWRDCRYCRLLKAVRAALVLADEMDDAYEPAGENVRDVITAALSGRARDGSEQ